MQELKQLLILSLDEEMIDNQTLENGLMLDSRGITLNQLLGLFNDYFVDLLIKSQSQFCTYILDKISNKDRETLDVALLGCIPINDALHEEFESVEVVHRS